MTKSKMFHLNKKNSYGVCRYGVYSCGPYSHGRYSHDLKQSWPYTVMALYSYGPLRLPEELEPERQHVHGKLDDEDEREHVPAFF